MKKVSVAGLMLLVSVFFAANCPCFAENNAEATKKLAGYINEKLLPDQLPEIKALLDQGADVDATNPRGRTLLMVASLLGHLDAAQVPDQ
jgi:ankyrin repeat protein